MGSATKRSKKEKISLLCTGEFVNGLVIGSEYSDRYVLDELGEKARKRLTDAEYSRMEWEAKNTITDNQALENFVNRWTREIDNSPINTEENELDRKKL